jgi:hypothetical protein
LNYKKNRTQKKCGLRDILPVRTYLLINNLNFYKDLWLVLSI